MQFVEARELLKMSTVPPDDLLINNRKWKLESTYLTRPEAMASADFMSSHKLFKYSNGYALYERNYD